MRLVDRILAELSQQALAEQVTRQHDEARISYRLRANTISDFDEYQKELGSYYTYHYNRCVVPGGTMPEDHARSKAKAIIVGYYRRQDGTLVNGFNDAQDGTHGLRQQLDIIADHLKSEAVEQKVIDVLDRYLPPSSWEAKLAFTKELLDYLNQSLPPSMQLGPPEKYAADVQQLVRMIVQARRQIANAFRRE